MKKPSRLKIARAARNEINKLQAQRMRVYKRAVKALNVTDDSRTWDWFFNTPNGGYSSFEQDLTQADFVDRGGLK